MIKVITFIMAVITGSAWSYGVYKAVDANQRRKLLDANPQHIKDFESSRYCDCGGNCE